MLKGVKNIDFNKDSLPLILPLTCILTIKNSNRDFVKMLNDIKDILEQDLYNLIGLTNEEIIQINNHKTNELQLPKDHLPTHNN